MVDFVCGVRPTRERKLRGDMGRLGAFLKIGERSVFFSLHYVVDSVCRVRPRVGHGGGSAEGNWII